MAIEYPTITPPFPFVSFEEMAPAQAQRHFDWASSAEFVGEFGLG